MKTPRLVPPFTSDGRAGSKQGGGAASTPRPRVGGEIHSAPGGHQGGEAAKTSEEREAWCFKTGMNLCEGLPHRDTFLSVGEGEWIHVKTDVATAYVQGGGSEEVMLYTRFPH